jgi:hypothetical protein
MHRKPTAALLFVALAELLDILDHPVIQKRKKTWQLMNAKYVV